MSPKIIHFQENYKKVYKSLMNCSQNGCCGSWVLSFEFLAMIGWSVKWEFCWIFGSNWNNSSLAAQVSTNDLRKVSQHTMEEPGIEGPSYLHLLAKNCVIWGINLWYTKLYHEPELPISDMNSKKSHGTNTETTYNLFKYF